MPAVGLYQGIGGRWSLGKRAEGLSSLCMDSLSNAEMESRDSKGPGVERENEALRRPFRREAAPHSFPTHRIPAIIGPSRGLPSHARWYAMRCLFPFLREERRGLYGLLPKLVALDVLQHKKLHILLEEMVWSCSKRFVTMALGGGRIRR